jgi:hypothetical protein
MPRQTGRRLTDSDPEYSQNQGSISQSCFQSAGGLPVVMIRTLRQDKPVEKRRFRRFTGDL